jgi:hypothetical protein
MSEARGGAGLKPKYVRKKCPHDKQKSLCKECGGSSLCEHNIQKYYCIPCGGKGICTHNSIRQNCIKCKGVSICDHNKRRSRCKICKGGSICDHDKLKSRCSICGGSEMCEHDRRREYCTECNGNQICEHNIRKERCATCGGSQLCVHGKDKAYCIKCHGSNICEHDRIRYQCIDCEGGRICEHKKRKSYCKQCGGSALCKSVWCETAGNVKYEGHCLNCFIHLFPDRPNARNYKTKEKAVVDYILENFPLDKYTWISDKRVKDGCSKRRPDLLLDLGYQVIIVEIDEHQHTDYDCTCENKRLMELSQDVYHRPIVFIRFNPDEYMDKDKKITSCWGVNKLGICSLKKTKMKEWNTRLEFLKSQIEYWSNSENMSDKTIQIVELFYNQSS